MKAKKAKKTKKTKKTKTTKTKKTKKPRAQLDREITAALSKRKRRPKYLLTSRKLIVIESDGDRDTTTWEDFVDANREMPELADVAEELRRHGRATVGGGAAPLTVIRLAD